MRLPSGTSCGNARLGGQTVLLLILASFAFFPPVGRPATPSGFSTGCECRAAMWQAERASLGVSGRGAVAEWGRSEASYQVGLESGP